MGIYDSAMDKFFDWLGTKVIVPILKWGLIGYVVLAGIAFVVTVGDGLSSSGLKGWILGDHSNWQIAGGIGYLLATIWLTNEITSWVIRRTFAGQAEDPEQLAIKYRTGKDTVVDALIFLTILIGPIALSWVLWAGLQ